MNLFTTFEARRHSAIRSERELSDLRLEAVSRRLDRAMLAVEALSEILCDRFGITGEEIHVRMDEIDLRDGKQDGRLAAGVVMCSACDRPNSGQSRQCVYCGHEPLTQQLAG
jgi:hypothetical protein